MKELVSAMEKETKKNVQRRFSQRQSLTKSSMRPYRGIGELSYSFHNRTALAAHRRRICIFKKKINPNTPLAGQALRVKEADDGIWLVSFMDYDLGYIDLEDKIPRPLNNPFGPNV